MRINGGFVANALHMPGYLRFIFMEHLMQYFLMIQNQLSVKQMSVCRYVLLLLLNLSTDGRAHNAFSLNSKYITLVRTLPVSLSVLTANSGDQGESNVLW